MSAERAEYKRGAIEKTPVTHLQSAQNFMIRLDNISKQNGHQLLFIDASMGVLKGEKVGLVGPNGAGKSTLFRMIAGQDRPEVPAPHLRGSGEPPPCGAHGRL